MKINEIISEGIGSLIGKGLVNLGSKMSGKAAAKTAQQTAQAAPQIVMVPPKTLKGQALKYGTIATGALGAKHYLTDPDNPSIGKALGRGFTDVVGGVKDFAKDVYQGATGDKSVSDTVRKAVDALPDPDDTQSEPQPGVQDDGDYVSQIRKRSEERFKDWPGQQNEGIKKKFKVVEADKKKSSFEIEVEKNFADPYVRKAILAKARQESGGRNIGEMDWTSTSNKRLRAAFPQFSKLDDTQLNNLKSQGNEVFLNAAYKNIGGYKYRGRGPIQITGKANYARIDKDLGLNGALVKDPDMLLRDPALANAASVQYLKNTGLHKKTFDNQRAAHQDVIYAIGGSLYAPGSKRGNQLLAQIEKYGPDGGSTTVAGTTSFTGSGAKPSDKTDTAQKQSAGSTAKSSDTVPPLSKAKTQPPKYVPSGPTIADIVAKADKELAANRAAAQRIMPTEPTSTVPQQSQKPPSAAEKSVPPDVKDVEWKDSNWVGKSSTGAAAGGAVKNIDAEKSMSTPPKDKGAWDKFIDTVTHGRVPPEELEKIKVPESINIQTELDKILRLAGRK